MLSENDKSDLERIQKIVLKVILGDRYLNYELACKSSSTTSLETRRGNLSLKFALSCLKNPQHTNFFKQRRLLYYKLRNTKSYEVPYCQTDRYFNSPIAALTRMLNQHVE